MASVKIPYVRQSCPKCGKKLLEVPASTTVIGSPLITCKKCKTVSHTRLRVEWYKYQPKWMVFCLPLMLFAGGIVTGALMGDLAIGIFAGILCGMIGLFISGKDIVRMILSKKRMRDINYLRQLLLINELSLDEYNEFSAKIKN